MKYSKGRETSKAYNRSMNSLLKYLLIIVCALSTHVLSATSLRHSTQSKKDHSLESKHIDWTGFYVGGMFGELWQKNKMTWHLLYPSSIYFVADPITNNHYGSGVSGGILTGYSYSLTHRCIIGFETDWSWAHINNGLTSTPWRDGDIVSAPDSQTHMKSTLHWLSSLRGRMGYLISSHVMAYGAAGIAWANIRYSANNTNGFGGNGLYITHTNFSNISAGYTVGAGLEWAMLTNLLLRAEYAYYQLSSTQNIAAQDTTGNYPIYPSHYSWGDASVNTMRAGLTYRFKG